MYLFEGPNKFLKNEIQLFDVLNYKGERKRDSENNCD